jgi:hypothetical protein
MAIKGIRLKGTMLPPYRATMAATTFKAAKTATRVISRAENLLISPNPSPYRVTKLLSYWTTRR